MFQKKISNKSATQNLKNLIIEKFKLNEDATVSIAELSCHEPNCPQKKQLLRSVKLMEALPTYEFIRLWIKYRGKTLRH